MTETPAAREALASVLAEHHPTGFVSSRNGWVECACGERLPCALDSDGYPLDEEGEARLFANHRADALLPFLAEREAAARGEVVARYGIAAELVVQDLRAQRGDHIAGLVEDSFDAHFKRAAALSDREA